MDGFLMLTQTELSILFEYREGKLYRRVPRGRSAADTQVGRQRKDGYMQFEINGCKYLLHRVIFTLLHGFTPAFIDHINGDKSDNRIENLRNVTRAQNNRNSKRRKTSKSGVKGVSWYARERKWVVRLYIDGSNRFFGAFETLEEAQKIAENTRERLHGPYACHG